jgi:hypothetical protein
LLIGWRVTDAADACPTERMLISEFRSHYHVRPFANMVN